MRRKRFWAVSLSAVLAVSMLSGCIRPQVTDDMIPAVTNLGMSEPSGETVNEAEVMGLSMNKSYMAELTRLDGDNTEAASVDAKTVPVVLKATSMDKDLKVKIVNEKNNKVITGTAFEVTVTDSNKKTKSYKDEDKDGIIYIKNMTPGSCSIAMKSSGNYSAPKDIKTEVKSSLEYKVVDVTDEIKKESEINVSKEDGSTNGNNDAGTATVLTDTVEFVASSKTEIKQQKKDKYGTPMYEKILREPAGDHKDPNEDGVCDRCGAKLACKNHTYNEEVTKEAACTEKGTKTLTCTKCGDKQTQEIPAKGHNYVDWKCTECGGEDPSKPAPGEPENPEPPVVSPSEVPSTASVKTRLMTLVGTAAEPDKIIYDTSSNPVMEGTGTYKYTGWQTIDGATYYYDKNGNKVTGSQVIQGIQYNFSSSGVRSGTIGIDVSKFQTSINWQKVKNAGINFAIIRCGYRGYGSGVLVEDPKFASHISGAKAAGLRVGVYFFSQAINEAEAVEEASMAVKLANRYGINMPIAIDSEYANGGRGRADGLSKADRTRITIAFCNTVANSGHTPMVYASKSWFSDHLSVSQFPGSYRIWVAHYANKCGYGGRYDIWQNTSKGRVDGVSGNVDMNVSSI